ncbi:DUF6177 family protein, partial [Streptomyces edwardsiae]
MTTNDPGKWSPASVGELAEVFRAQKSASTWLVAVGAPDRPAIATCRVIHTPAGIEEHLTLALGYTTDRIAPLDVL